MGTITRLPSPEARAGRRVAKAVKLADQIIGSELLRAFDEGGSVAALDLAEALADAAAEWLERVREEPLGREAGI